MPYHDNKNPNRDRQLARDDSWGLMTYFIAAMAIFAIIVGAIWLGSEENTAFTTNNNAPQTTGLSSQGLSPGAADAPAKPAK